MARIYSNTRTLLDPSLLQMANAAVNERLRRDAERRAPVVSSIRDILKSTAGTISDYRGERTRANEVSDWDIGNDPIANAAREEYIRTGSSGPLMNYQMQKMAAEQRAADAKRAAEEKAQSDAFHKAVRIAQARPEYAKIQKSMLDAVDAGDMETADIMQKQLQAYETEFGSDTFGQDAASILESRKKAAIINQAKKAEEERLAKQAENIEKDFNDRSYSQRIWVETNILPELKNITDKAEAHNQVERMSRNLTDEDRKILHDKIDKVETLAEKKAKAKENVKATKTGEQTGKAIDKATNKANAQKYVGRKMNILEYKKIPEEVREFLVIDGQGNISEKK